MPADVKSFTKSEGYERYYIALFINDGYTPMRQLHKHYKTKPYLEANINDHRLYNIWKTKSYRKLWFVSTTTKINIPKWQKKNTR